MAVREGFESLQHCNNSLHINNLNYLRILKSVHLGC